MSAPQLARRLVHPHEAIIGDQVITINGARIGVVSALSQDALVIRSGLRLFGTLRQLPLEAAVVRDIDRSVITLVPPDELDRLTGRRRRRRPSPETVARLYDRNFGPLSD